MITHFVSAVKELSKNAPLPVHGLLGLLGLKAATSICINARTPITKLLFGNSAEVLADERSLGPPQVNA